MKTKKVEATVKNYKVENGQMFILVEFPNKMEAWVSVDEDLEFPGKKDLLNTNFNE